MLRGRGRGQNFGCHFVVPHTFIHTPSLLLLWLCPLTPCGAVQFGDCCPDYAAVCGDGGADTTTAAPATTAGNGGGDLSCVGRCGIFNAEFTCQCDPNCADVSAPSVSPC